MRLRRRAGSLCGGLVHSMSWNFSLSCGCSISVSQRRADWVKRWGSSVVSSSVGWGAIGLIQVAQALLRELGAADDRDARPVAWAMAQGGWAWGPSVLAALGEEGEADKARSPAAGLDVWRRLPEWSEHAPPPPPASIPVEPEEARNALNHLLDANAEPRPSQADYASATSGAFRPRDQAGAPNFVLAEAGTASARHSVISRPPAFGREKNEAPVWLSTYTRNLQHQIDQEWDRRLELAAQSATGRGSQARKLPLPPQYGRSAARCRGDRNDAISLGLMARWARTRDGDLTGGDFPSWLVDLLRRPPDARSQRSSR